VKAEIGKPGIRHRAHPGQIDRLHDVCAIRSQCMHVGSSCARSYSSCEPVPRQASSPCGKVGDAPHSTRRLPLVHHTVRCATRPRRK
jgi:hypothetical protein